MSGRPLDSSSEGSVGNAVSVYAQQALRVGFAATQHMASDLTEIEVGLAAHESVAPERIREKASPKQMHVAAFVGTAQIDDRPCSGWWRRSNRKSVAKAQVAVADPAGGEQDCAES